MTSEEYIKLYQKYIKSKCSDEEVRQLFDYKDDFQLLEEHETVEDEVLKAKIRSKIAEGIKISQHKPNRAWYRYAAAAIITMVVGITLLINQRKHKISNEHGRLSAQKESDLKIVELTAPVLTLTDGSNILLDEVEDGLLIKESGTEIIKTQNGELTYNTSDRLIGNSNSINKITIPRGETYKIILADGTKVWLNATSSLSYPSRFNGAERRVKLVGEAYFEVARNEGIPFIVEMKDAEVEVLGTHFNISAYDNDHKTKATLLEGSIRLSHWGIRKILRPGEQGVIMEGSTAIILKKVNTSQILAWKDGYFLFKENTIEEVMNQIARWYKVQIVYNSKVEGKLFGGIYAKSKKIEELLKGLELTGLVKFKIDESSRTKERRVIVMD